PVTYRSDVEADLQHVAVDDHIVLALDAQLASFLRLGPRPDLEQVAPEDDFGTDETALQVGVDHARALRRGSTGTERPRTRLLLTRGQERRSSQRAERAAGQPRHDALRDAEVREQLGPLRTVGCDDVGITLELYAHRQRVAAEGRGKCSGVVELV